MGDLKFAARQLAKTPGFTAAAVLTLTLGIGANTAMFSVVDAVLLRSLPYDEPGRLVHVWEAPKPGEGNSVSVGVYLDWVRHGTAFEALAAVSNSALNLTDGGEPERISGLHMSPSGLRILRGETGARPCLRRGRGPARRAAARGDDERPLACGASAAIPPSSAARSCSTASPTP